MLKNGINLDHIVGIIFIQRVTYENPYKSRDVKLKSDYFNNQT